MSIEQILMTSAIKSEKIFNEKMNKMKLDELSEGELMILRREMNKHEQRMGLFSAIFSTMHHVIMDMIHSMR